MKHSSTSILPRLRKSSARLCSTRDSVPSSTHRWKRRWQVWYEGNRSGRSFQRAPERKIHNIPFNTARSSQRGRPRPSTRRCTFGSSGSIKSHCSSCNSSRRGITISRYPTGKTVFHINRLLGIFETASSNYQLRMSDNEMTIIGHDLYRVSRGGDRLAGFQQQFLQLTHFCQGQFRH